MIISHIPSFLNCPLRLKIILLVFRIPPILFNRLLFGCFDEFNQRQNFLFWLLIETAFPIIRCQLFPEIDFHRKVRMPAFNSSRARDITTFPQTVGKSNLIPKFWASDFQLLKHNLTSRKFYNFLKNIGLLMATCFCHQNGIMECWNIGSKNGDKPF